MNAINAWSWIMLEQWVITQPDGAYPLPKTSQ
jgi:hypothetical protein